MGASVTGSDVPLQGSFGSPRGQPSAGLHALGSTHAAGVPHPATMFCTGSGSSNAILPSASVSDQLLIITRKYKIFRPLSHLLNSWNFLSCLQDPLKSSKSFLSSVKVSLYSSSKEKLIVQSSLHKWWLLFSPLLWGPLGLKISTMSSHQYFLSWNHLTVLTPFWYSLESLGSQLSFFMSTWSDFRFLVDDPTTRYNQYYGFLSSRDFLPLFFSCLLPFSPTDPLFVPGWQEAAARMPSCTWLVVSPSPSLVYYLLSESSPF